MSLFNIGKLAVQYGPRAIAGVRSLLSDPVKSTGLVTGGILGGKATEETINSGILSNTNLLEEGMNLFSSPSTFLINRMGNIDTPDGAYLGPTEAELEKLRKQQEELSNKGKIVTPIPKEERVSVDDTGFTQVQQESGLLSTPEPEPVDGSNITPLPPDAKVSDYILTAEEQPTQTGLLLDKPNENSYPDGEGMFVIHNTGEGALINYDKIGGMPKPSLAIAKENIDELNFGDITLIGDPSMMNPSRNNPVYKGDAYTQRYPTVRTIYNDDEMNKIIKYFSDTFNVNDIRYDAKEIGNYKFEDGSDQRIFYTGDLYNQINEKGISNLDNTMLEMTFLKEKGLLPEFTNYKNKFEYTKAVDDVFTPELDSEYKVWANNLANKIGVQGQEKILVGRTPMGRLKYKDHTLDNVLNYMSSASGKEEGFGESSLGNLASTMRGKFKNIEEVKSSRDKLITNTEMTEFKSGLYTDLDNIITKLAEEHPERASMDTYGDNFINVFKDKKYSIDQSFKEFYPNASPETIEMTKKFFKKLAEAPSEYFEIKPNRAVGIDEFKGAIVPYNISDEALEILKNNGINRIFKYNSQPDRLKKLQYFKDLFANNSINSGLLSVA